MKKLNKKGFTIVELVIVIAVIAILAAVLIPTFGNVIKKAKESGAMQQAAACYKEAMAVDLADGKQDGKINATTAIDATQLTGYEGCTITYTVTEAEAEGKTTITFTFVTADGYTVTSAGDGKFVVVGPAA